MKRKNLLFIFVICLTGLLQAQTPLLELTFTDSVFGLNPGFVDTMEWHSPIKATSGGDSLSWKWVSPPEIVVDDVLESEVLSLDNCNYLRIDTGIMNPNKEEWSLSYQYKWVANDVWWTGLLSLMGIKDGDYWISNLALHKSSPAYVYKDNDWGSLSTGSVFNVGEWNHLAFTFSDADSIVRMYLNGDSLTESKYYAFLDVDTLWLDFSTKWKVKNGDSTYMETEKKADPLTGIDTLHSKSQEAMLDNVKFYDVVLTAEEVNGLWLQESPELTDISLDKYYYISLGDSITLSADIAPVSGTHDLSWMVDDESVAIIDENGKLNSKAAGSVKVTVTDAISGLFAYGRVFIMDTATASTAYAEDFNDDSKTWPYDEYTFNDSVHVSDKGELRFEMIGSADDHTVPMTTLTLDESVSGVFMLNYDIWSQRNTIAFRTYLKNAGGDTLVAGYIGDGSDKSAGLYVDLDSTRVYQSVSNDPSVKVEALTGGYANKKWHNIQFIVNTSANLVSFAFNGIQGDCIDIPFLNEGESVASIAFEFFDQWAGNKHIVIDNLWIRELGEVPVDGIIISTEGNQKILEIDDTLQCYAAADPAYADNDTLVWSIGASSTGSATIDADGKLIGVSEGIVVLVSSATDGYGAVDSIEIEVFTSIINVTSVEVSAASSTVVKGGTVQCSAAVLPVDATDPSVTWSVSDDAIANIDQAGLLTSVDVGTVTVYATSNDGTAIIDSVSVEVLPIPVATINLTASADSVEIDSSITIAAEVLPADAADKSVTWSVSDETIANVVDGVVTGKSSGTVTVTATANDGSGVKGTITIMVYSTVGIDQPLARKLNIYPNPANSIVYISGINNATIEIFDITGNLVKFETNTKSINVSDLDAGLYIIQVNNSISKKLIIE